MGRPGLKRLVQAQRAKVQLNLAGTSNSVSHTVASKRAIDKMGVQTSEDGSTQGSTRILKKFNPSYTPLQKNADRCCDKNKNKVWGRRPNGKLIGATY